MGSLSKSKQLAADQALLAGIVKHLTGVPIIVDSQAQTLAQLTAVIQGRIDAAQAVVTARLALHAAVVAQAIKDDQTAAYVTSLREGVQAMFANSPDILADFGEVPRKARTPLTAAEKVIAAEKARATRQARGTVGKKKKAEIRGTLAGNVVVAPNGSTTVQGSSGSAAPSPAPVPPAAPSPAPATSPGSPGGVNGAAGGGGVAQA